jgi:acetyl esterase/lipase
MMTLAILLFGLQDSSGLAYREAAPDAYAAERCRLDLYLPAGKRDFPTLVWFHGGGLEGGDKGSAKALARALNADGVAVASANYRLSPKATYPAYLEDAAAAAVWVRKGIAVRGGDAARVFVGGHSAGGYLALMLALDARLLQAQGSRPADFAGYFPVSGQTVTHYTVRKERGLPQGAIVADEASPLRWVRKDAPPLLILAGEKDLPTRVEENRLLHANLRSLGAQRLRFLVLPDRDHGTVASKLAEDGDPGRAALLEFLSGR